MTNRIFIVAAVMCGFCFAGGPVKVAVKFNVQDGDRVGSKLIYRIKENVRESNGMVLSTIDKNSDVQIEVITLMIPLCSGETSHPSTAYSVLYTFTAGPLSYRTAMYHSIGLCDDSSVNDKAEGITIKTDQLIQTFKIGTDK